MADDGETDPVPVEEGEPLEPEGTGDPPPAVETSAGEEDILPGEAVAVEEKVEETGDAPLEESEVRETAEPGEVVEPGESVEPEPSMEEAAVEETEGLTAGDTQTGDIVDPAEGERQAEDEMQEDEGRISPVDLAGPSGELDEDDQVDVDARSGQSDPGRGSPNMDDELADGELSGTMVQGENFGYDDGEGDEMDYGEEMEDDEDKVDPLQELQEKYDQLVELSEQANHTNVALQRRVIQRKSQDKSYDASEKQSEGKVTEHKYQNVLLHVHQVRLKLRLQQVKAARMSEELKNQLEAKRQKAIECRDSFQEFKRQVARHAEYARTGKKIPEKIIQEVEEFELDKDAEVEEVRGSNISLKNRLAKLEQLLRKKDELAENLHVIDFEQLKIENQTLNEKIEERNEELHKLRKKTIVTVQIITHMREKVQFVQQEYLALKSELAQLDLDLAAQRDLVTRTKHERDDVRGEIAKHRQQTGITNSEGLSRDYEARAEHIKELIQEIAQLKNRHKQMLAFLKRHGSKV